MKEIKISPLFHGAEANFQEDIAIVVLVTPFVYKTYVRPVCLNFDTNFEERQLVPNQLGKVGLTTNIIKSFVKKIFNRFQTILIKSTNKNNKN